MLGEENATDAELMETGRRFFTAMNGQSEGTSMSLARYNLYTRKKWKPLRIMALPPTEVNLLIIIMHSFPDIEDYLFFDNGGPHLHTHNIHIILQHFK